MNSLLQNKLLTKYRFFSIIPKRTLILGDVSTGKTTLTALLLMDALRSETIDRITIIDMAPEKKLYKGKSIGGKISDVLTIPSGVRMLRPRKVNAPRYSAIDRNDLIRQVEENSVMIEEALDLYLKDITPILFVNDLSLYFQSGKYHKAFQVMEESETFVGNAYHGESLEDDLGTGISFKERELVKSFSSKTDLLIHL